MKSLTMTQLLFDFRPKIISYCLLPVFSPYFCIYYSDHFFKKYIIRIRRLTGYFLNPSVLLQREFYRDKIYRSKVAVERGYNLFNIRLHNGNERFSYFSKAQF